MCSTSRRPYPRSSSEAIRTVLPVDPNQALTYAVMPAAFICLLAAWLFFCSFLLPKLCLHQKKESRAGKKEKLSPSHYRQGVSPDNFNQHEVQHKKKTLQKLYRFKLDLAALLPFNANLTYLSETV